MTLVSGKSAGCSPSVGQQTPWQTHIVGGETQISGDETQKSHCWRITHVFWKNKSLGRKHTSSGENMHHLEETRWIKMHISSTEKGHIRKDQTGNKYDKERFQTGVQDGIKINHFPPETCVHATKGCFDPSIVLV